ncbi:hypothetical protein DET59_103235 [Rossellomorea aquimaris]|uniref:Uncharacterized protein n=1 Tax=Rossellomorea aquimaris TaxID=189382 RepID=A0A366EXA7_9BACI|nr:hypothetical protein DET59_103235 [Rossellomorea aquimaris]
MSVPLYYRRDGPIMKGRREKSVVGVTGVSGENYQLNEKLQLSGVESQLK